MTEMVRKADVHRMLVEAFQQGADNPQLIPNLMGSLAHFMPKFDIELTEQQVQEAEEKCRKHAEEVLGRFYG